jgi:hypothetical protein
LPPFSDTMFVTPDLGNPPRIGISVDVGMPGKTVYLALDSLSSDLAIPPTLTYNPAASDTYVTEGHHNNATFVNALFGPRPYGGPESWERINFNLLTEQGQQFLLNTETLVP